MFKKKLILILFLLLFFSACSIKNPITWEKRILNSPTKSKVSLIYKEYGNSKNKTILFLHGFGESKETWRFLIPLLSKKYHLIMLDLKGFGESPKVKDDAYSVYDQAQEVAHFIKEKKLNNITLVGRSFGGGIALVLALMQEEGLIKPNIIKLILINSMAYKQNLPSMLKILEKPIIGYLAIHLISNKWMAEEAYKFAFYNNDLISRESLTYSTNYLSRPMAKYVYLQTVHQLIPDDIQLIQSKYKAITLPSLILWGKEDVSIHLTTAYKLNRDLKKSELKVFSNVGHIPNEETPNRIAFEILRFMNKSN